MDSDDRCLTSNTAVAGAPWHAVTGNVTRSHRKGPAPDGEGGPPVDAGSLPALSRSLADLTTLQPCLPPDLDEQPWFLPIRIDLIV